MLTNVGSGGGAAPAAGGAAAGGDAAAAPAAEEEKAKEEEKEDVRVFFSCSFNHSFALCAISQMTTWASVSSIRAKIASYHYRFASPDRQSAICLVFFFCCTGFAMRCLSHLSSCRCLEFFLHCEALRMSTQIYHSLFKTACW